MRLHFISGMPRAGSTLLAAILNQNPRFTAGMTSPVGHIYRAMESAMGRSSEGSIFVGDVQRRALLTGIFTSFYAGAPEVVFDTSRLWCAKLPALDLLFPAAKVICCVRDLAWIMDSFERLHARNPLEPSGIYGFDTGSTAHSRCAALQGADGTVGWAFNAVKEAMAGQHRGKLHLVEYDALCRHPRATLQAIYDFIGEEPFEHDFDNVRYSASEFDRSIGARGLHDVSGKVEWRPRETILPPDIFARYANDQFWRESA